LPTDEEKVERKAKKLAGDKPDKNDEEMMMDYYDDEDDEEISD
jgi:hypothetical protein